MGISGPGLILALVFGKITEIRINVNVVGVEYGLMTRK